MWLLACVPALAEPATEAEDAADLVRKIEARYASIRTLSAEFVQKVSSPIYGDDSQAGTLLLERPNRMRWQFTGEEGRLFVADGQWLWMYSPADRQVVKAPQVEGAGGTDVLLESLAHLSERFTPTFTPPPPGGTWHLVLVPRDPKHPYRRYEVGLSADFSLEQLILVDPQNTVTRLDFRAVQLGGVPPGDAFTFVPPPGVEVVPMGAAP
jgi:outer membrane lipoprotein carrier protein